MCTERIDTRCQRDHLRRLGAVASQHDNLVDAAGSKPAQGLGCFPTHIVGQPQHRFQFAVHGHETATAGQIVQLLQACLCPVARIPALLHECQQPQAHGFALYLAGQALAWSLLHLLRRRQSQAPCKGRVDNGPSDRMGGGLGQRRGPLQDLQRRALSVKLDRLQPGVATGQGTSLVEKDLADSGERLQYRAIAHQNATPRRSRDARQHGNRHRQYQRAGCGDHQHGQHTLRVATGPPGERGDQQCQRDESQRVAVSQAHEGCP